MRFSCVFIGAARIARMAAIPESVRDLLDRVERRLPDRPIVEKRMFGTVALMLDGEMIVAAQKDGSLLVRVSRDADAELMQRPEAGRLLMGGTPMGAGWIRVDESAVADDEQLDFWIGHALARRA